LLADLPADASEEEITARLKAAGVSESDMGAMMGAIKGKGRMLVESGGVYKVSNIEENNKRALDAFDQAILDHKNRKKIEIPELSPESRALMEKILASESSQEEISSRVAALLAGTSLSTSRGLSNGERREIDMVEYEGANLSEARERKDNFEMPDIPMVNGVSMRDHSGGAGTIKRGSIKRQSEIMREKKKSRQEEREEERERKASYFRKVTGLRRAKVPLMVYSCGGFSRCFRIARFYDIEGPPVGVEYSRADDRKELNPDL